MNGTLYTVDEFRTFVENDINGFVTQVCLDINNRTPTEQEMRAMAQSYPVVSQMLAAAIAKNEGIAHAHVGFSSVKFEYKLPSAPAWCDVVILGEGHGQKQAFVIELKDWYPNTTDQPGMCEGLIYHQGHQQQHPSDQVKGYVQYCRNYHSEVLATHAEVNGCAFFTQNLKLEPYVVVPNDRLVEEFPSYNYQSLDALAERLVEHIESGDEEWATRFVNGYYQQNRNILRQVALAFERNSDERPFVLLDCQRIGFLKVMHRLSEAVNQGEGKRVIIVAGPPGSGKSAIALNLWVEAVRKYVTNDEGSHPGNVVFVTTSTSQNDNWKNVFDRYSSIAGANGLVMRSNNFNPGMNGSSMKKTFLPIFRKKGTKYLKNPDSLKYEYYEEYTQYMIDNSLSNGYKDNLHFLSIVDEAHALINPLAPGFSTNSLGGWCMQMGPQAYHIIRESRISVFLMDGEQSFRDNETTTVDDIRRIAKRLGAQVEDVDLAGLQFRCAGSAEYVEWVGSLFANRQSMNVPLWRDLFKVKVFGTTHEMEKYLRDRMSEGQSARLLSSCTVPWISDKSLDEMHTHESENLDFDFVNSDGVPFKRHWNNPRRMDIFVQAPEYSRMGQDALCEVGCPYEIRGFDFDWVGVLWLGDIVRRDHCWMLDLNKCVDRANKSSKSQAVREVRNYLKQKGCKCGNGEPLPLVPLESAELPKTSEIAKTVVQAYRILMTRAVKGACLFIQDEETRTYVEGLLNG